MSGSIIARGPSTVRMRFRPGLVGPAGPANSLSIGAVTTGAAGTPASAAIAGTAPAQTLSLTIPKGDQGVAGPASSLTIGTVTTGAPGSAASASIAGVAPNQSLSLTIPRGDAGASGAGSGNVNPTGGSYASNKVALFSDTTGNLIKAGPVLGDAAVKNTGTTAGTLAAGDDPRFSVAAPPGMVSTFYTVSAPAGWLKANGQAVSRSTYAALWVAMGSPNTGDGSTTFTLPDLRAEFVRGLDDGRGVDVGRMIGSFQAQMIQNHVHPVGTSANGAYGSPFDNFISDNLANTKNTDNPLSGGGPETRPRNIALLYCIKT